MQPNELKALLTKTNEVAIQPVHVEVQVENSRVGRGSRRFGQIYCPSGLIKAKVLEDGVKWTEHRSISVCGDQDYEIQRKNGVLVEIDPDDMPQGILKIRGRRVFKSSSKTAYPHCTADRKGPDGKYVIHLITSRKAIFSSWGEYALEMAKREKEEQERQEKYARLRRPQAALMGFEGDLKFYNNPENRNRFGYLSIDYERQDYDYVKKEYIENEKRGPSIGHIEITVDQAEKIWNMLTPKQRKALKS